MKIAIKQNLTDIFAQREDMGALKKLFYDLLIAIGLRQSQVEWVVSNAIAQIPVEKNKVEHTHTESAKANRFSDYKNRLLPITSKAGTDRVGTVDQQTADQEGRVYPSNKTT